MLETLVQLISAARSRNNGVSIGTPSPRAASAINEKVLPVTCGSSTPCTRGQKYLIWRSAAEWKVRACTCGTPSSASRCRSSPAALVVNVTASVRPGSRAPEKAPYAMRWVMARVLPVPAPASTATGAPKLVATARCWASKPASTSVARD